MTRKITILAATVAVIAAASVSVAAVAQSGEQPKVSVQEPVPAADQGLAATVSILDRPHTPSDELPQDIADGYSQRQPFGINGRLARKAFSTESLDVFVAPADRHACIITTPRDGTSFTACQTVDSIENGTNRPATSVEYERVTILGIVPDGVKTISVHFANGEQAEHPVDGNVYLVQSTVSNQATSVTYDGPNGRIQLETIRHDPEKVKNLRSVEETS